MNLIFAIMVTVYYTSVALIVEAVITEEQKSTLQVIRKLCVESTSANNDLVEKIRSGDLQEEPSLKKYLVCMVKAGGFIDDAGIIQKDVIVQNIGNAMDDVAAIARIIEECASQKANVEDTVYITLKCFIKKYPKISQIL